MDGVEKVRVQVELDRALVDLESEAGIDVSEVTDRALKRALGAAGLKLNLVSAERLEAFQDEVRSEIAWYNDRAVRHGLFADEWRKF